MTRVHPLGRSRRVRRALTACAVVLGMLVPALGATPAHASLPLTFTHMTGLPRHATPTDVAVDGNGDLYVTDQETDTNSTNDRVVKYDADGTFLDVLAGPGTTAGLVVNPISIAVAPNGDVYVLEAGYAGGGQNEVSVFDNVGNYLFRWGAFGTGNGQFKAPLGVAVDSSGNVYVADTGNGRVQKFTSNGTWVQSLAITGPKDVSIDATDTVWVISSNSATRWTTGLASAGSSIASSGATGVSVDALGHVWISSSSNNAVRAYDTGGNLLWTVGSGELSAPAGVQITDGGVLYVADTGHGRIARYGSPWKDTSWSSTGVMGVALDGSIVEGAGGNNLRTFDTSGSPSTSWSSNGAYDAAPDGAGNVWVSSNADGVVTEYDGSGNVVTTIGSGILSSPKGVAYYGGKVFVADAGNNRIARLDPIGDTLETSWPLTGVRDLAVSSGTVYATDGTNLRTYTTNGAVGPAWGSAGSNGVAVDGSGNVWASSLTGGVVRKYTSGGTFVMAVGAGQLSTPQGVAVTASKVFVGDSGTDKIYRFSTGVAFQLQWGQYPNPGVEDAPTGIATDASGNVYVTNKAQDVIQKFDSAGNFLTQWGGTGNAAGQLSNPVAVAVSPVSGDVYVADTVNERIQRFTNTGAYVGEWGGFGTGDAQFDTPSGITIDASGNVYVADTNNNRIQKFNASGGFITKWGSFGTGDGQFKGPKGIAIDLSGNVWVADPGNNRIQSFGPAGAFLSKIGGTSSSPNDGKFASPRDIDVDAEGALWVVEASNYRIQRITTAGVFISKLGSQGLDIDQFNQPQGIAIDPSGTVLVADTLNNRVQTFVDQNGPDVTFDPGGPATVSPSTSATFAFHANEPGSTYECKLDAAPAYASCVSGVSVNSLAEGPHTFYVRATDAINNVGNPSTYDWSVDTTSPGVVIDAAPSGTVGNATANISYHSTEPNSSFKCSLDGAAQASCGSSFSQGGLASGDHTFDVWSIDQAGNQSTTPASASWTVDATPPVVHIQSGPNGFSSHVDATFDFDSPEGTATFECHLDGTAYAPCTSPITYNDLAVGQHTFYVRGKDTFGNLSADKTQTWTIDKSDHKPDAWVGFASKYVGNNVYNTTGSNQTKTEKTIPGKTLSFSIRVENDGTDTDTYTLKGAGSATGYTVSYFYGTIDYTNKVTSGTYSFSLAPGAYKSLSMKVKVTSKGKNAWSGLIEVTSGHDPSKQDDVKAAVKRT